MGQVPVVVDGMTGTGKSTLVNHLAEKLNLEVMPEEFRDPYDLLNKYSQDSKWCYPMQLNFLMTRFIQYTVASDNEKYILDRSIFSDPVYAKLFYEFGHLSEKEYNNYLTFFNTLMETIKKPKCMIILTCSFDEVMNRIEERGREDELRLGKDYWWALYQAYQEHVKSIMENEKESKIIEIDTESLNLDNIDEELEGVVKNAKEAI
ncbi:deoxynucleoside kinase [Natranaerofaba carboxydovora]|uniref:deoxynucleoside kinase n=1 Tax=Natranaerofaba carboxydovora TaxID=2742683 RepID=UPI001F1355DD|nr:deoxynucleoside kinase [Natranaerofaba carboxydovora]UMZ72632.1 Deoxyadenosine/deoxycytidine kinase [Natranaerofaba carboxydovora]